MRQSSLSTYIQVDQILKDNEANIVHTIHFSPKF